MAWRPNLKTIEDISTFVEDLFDVSPEIMGIDEVICGCEIIPGGIPAGAPPKYITVALGGSVGGAYQQAVLYRGGLSGLAAGDFVTVIHLREGNRYEVLGPGGAAGIAVDPAPVNAQYITMALDATLTDERVLTAGDWLALTDGGAGGLATLNFEPDLPVVVSAGGVIAEYATIQLAITAAGACETVLVPPGTYNEDITLKNGVCVKGFGPRDKIRITGDISIVTTAGGGWLENVTVVMTNPPFADASSAVRMVHNGTCHIRQITIIGTQAAANPIRGIGVTGTGAGLLIVDDVIIDISSAGNQAAYGVHLNLDSYELEMKNFKITVDNSNGGAASWALGIVQASACTIKATEGWLNVTATGAGTATDLSGTITYSEIVNTSDYTLFGQRVGIGMTTSPPHTLTVDSDTASIRIRNKTATRYRSDWSVVAAGVGLNAYDDTGAVYIPFKIDAKDLVLNTSVGAGNVGVGTAGPADLVHIYSTANTRRALTVDAKGTSAWQEAALFLLTLGDGTKSIGNAATKGWLLSARGNAYGVAAQQNDLVLGYWSGAAWSDIMFWEYNTGYVGVNTVTPGYRLDVYESLADGWAARVWNDGNAVNYHGITVWAGADNPAAVGNTFYFVAADGDGGTTGYLITVNGVFQLVDASDERLKTNIKDTKVSGLAIIDGLKVRDFNWKANPDGPIMTSFVAQEAQKVYPDMVVISPEGTLGTSRSMLIPILVKAIQEQQAQIKRLQLRNEVSK